MSKTTFKMFVLSLAAALSLNVFAAPVDINSADAQTLASALKGVGLKKAEAIVAYRDSNGKFTTAMDLTAVKGIGDKTVIKNQEDIALSAEELQVKVQANKRR